MENRICYHRRPYLKNSVVTHLTLKGISKKFENHILRKYVYLDEVELLTVGQRR